MPHGDPDGLRLIDQPNWSGIGIAFPRASYKEARFAGTPPLEFLAQFIDSCVGDHAKKMRVATTIFGAYNAWLALLGDSAKRERLETVSHEDVDSDAVFQEVREIGKEFASGLKLLFFDREIDDDPIANLSLEYVGF